MNLRPLGYELVVGGGLFGFAGMILGVPTFAVIYALTREWVERHLAEKDIAVTLTHRPLIHLKNNKSAPGSLDCPSLCGQHKKVPGKRNEVLSGEVSCKRRLSRF